MLKSAESVDEVHPLLLIQTVVQVDALEEGKNACSVLLKDARDSHPGSGVYPQHAHIVETGEENRNRRHVLAEVVHPRVASPKDEPADDDSKLRARLKCHVQAPDASDRAALDSVEDEPPRKGEEASRDQGEVWSRPLSVNELANGQKELGREAGEVVGAR